MRYVQKGTHSSSRRKIIIPLASTVMVDDLTPPLFYVWIESSTPVCIGSMVHGSKAFSCFSVCLPKYASFPRDKVSIPWLFCSPACWLWYSSLMDPSLTRALSMLKHSLSSWRYLRGRMKSPLFLLISWTEEVVEDREPGPFVQLKTFFLCPTPWA